MMNILQVNHKDKDEDEEVSISNFIYEPHKVKKELEELRQSLRTSGSDNVVQKLKWCYNLAEQLFEYPLSEKEGLKEACYQLQYFVDQIYHFCVKARTEGAEEEREKVRGYYYLAKGNIKFRTGLIFSRWEDFHYHLCYEARDLFQSITKNRWNWRTSKNEDERLCYWLARHMGCKCERELTRYRYHYLSGDIDLSAGEDNGFKELLAELCTDMQTLELPYLHIALDAAANVGRCFRNMQQFQKAADHFELLRSELARYFPETEENNQEIKEDSVSQSGGGKDQDVPGYLNIILSSIEKMRNRNCVSDEEPNKILKPHYEQILVNLMICHIELGKNYSQAEEVGKTLNKVESRNIDLKNNLAWVYRKQWKYDAALECLDNVIQDLKFWKTQTLESQKLLLTDSAPQRGESPTQPIISREGPINRFTILEQAKCLIKMRKFQQAEEKLTALREYYPRDQEVLLWQAIWYRNQKQLQEAVNLLERICADRPVVRRGTVSFKAWYVMGTCYLEWNRYNEAKNCFDKICACDENDIPAIKNLGWCLQLMGFYMEAITHYENMVEKVANQEYLQRQYDLISLYNNLGQCYVYTGKYDKGWEYFCRAIYLEQGNSRAICGAAHCLRRFLAVKKDSKSQDSGSKVCIGEIPAEWLKKGKINNQEGLERADYYRLAVYVAQMAVKLDVLNPHVNSEYVLCLLQALNQEMDFAEDNPYERDLLELLKKADPLYGSQFCVEALAELGAYFRKRENTKKMDYTPFLRFRPMDCEASSGQLEELLDALRKMDFTRGKDENKGKLMARVYEIQHIMDQIKGSLRIPRGAQNGVTYRHYTRMDRLKNMLLPKGGEPGRFRLSNVAYMNDSAEGEPFVAWMEDDQSDREWLSRYGLTQDSQIPFCSGLRNVYLTSLCTADDYIYMWAIYADKGTGCNLCFSDNFFDLKDCYPAGFVPFYKEQNSYPLYRIVYLPEQKDAEKTEEMQAFASEIKKLKGLLMEVDKLLADKAGGQPLQARIGGMLDQVRYLFKYNEFREEKEVRCLVVAKDYKIDQTDESKPPYLYTEIQKEVTLQEVCLGPKAADNPAAKAWLYATGRVKQLSNSKRHYC